MSDDVFKLDLPLLKQPEDLWGRLFLAWLKTLSEQNQLNQQLLGTVEKATEALHGAVAELSAEATPELDAAMQSLNAAYTAWRKQSGRSLDNVEEIAVLLQMIIAEQD